MAVDTAQNAYVAGFTTSTDFPTTPGAFQASAPGGGADAIVRKIDPTGAVVYSTYLGGSSIDEGFAIALDSSEDAYVTGTTESTDFPVLNAFQPALAGGGDAFVTELNPTGSALIYSSYLGGSISASINSQQGDGIAVDSAGGAYVTGETQSSDFPTTPNAFQAALGGGQCGSSSLPQPCSDAFITKVGAGGSGVLYSTYLGGSSADFALGIGLDAAGDAYIAGGTDSADFPVLNAFEPSCPTKIAGTLLPCAAGFIAELDPSGSALVFSTYLGGSSGDEATGVALDAVGDIYLTGGTASIDFPLANAFQTVLRGSVNGFVTEFNAGASQLIYSTFLGGSTADQPHTVAVDSYGEAFITGWTESTDFPTANAIQGSLGCSASGTGSCMNAFVTALQAGGAGLAYSTYLGNGEQLGFAIATDAGGDAWVTGASGTATFAAAISRPGLVHRQASPRPSTTTSGVQQGFGGSIALDMARVSAAPASLSFSPQVANTTSAAQAVTISNPGTAPLRFSAITPSNSFSVASGGSCSTSGSVAPNTSCTVDVAFAPTVGGNLTGTLTLTDNGIGSPHTVALSGTGQDVALSTNQNSASVAAGGTATFTLSITPQGGFNQTVNLSCSLPATLKFSTCAVTPASVTPSGTTASTATVTLTTTAPTLVAPRSEPYDSGRRGPLEVPPFGRMPWTDSRRPLLLWLVALLGAVVAASRHRRHSRGGGNQWVPA
ncbi:MAG: hypothetical protein DMG22_20450, partial [Acidobacteria bacterium]